MFTAEVTSGSADNIMLQLNAILGNMPYKACNIFIDFQTNSEMCFADEQNRIYGKKEDGSLELNHELDALKYILEDLNESEVPHPRKEGEVLKIKGLSKLVLDKPTRSFFLKTNTESRKQLKDKNRVFIQYFMYMSLYRAFKIQGGQPNEKTGRPTNYAKNEHDLFISGYIPLMLFSAVTDYELRGDLLLGIEKTPLREGYKLSKGYDVAGQPLADHEMLWVSKRAAFNFIEMMHPGTGDILEYKDITARLTLYCLLTYLDLIDQEAFVEDYGERIPPLPPRSEVPFRLELDGLGIRRMTNL